MYWAPQCCRMRSNLRPDSYPELAGPAQPWQPCTHLTQCTEAGPPENLGGPAESVPGHGCAVPAFLLDLMIDAVLLR